ncbi:hypothetical protein QQS21_006647 [Conoideocrella luteorostrata]|uniref:Uncharacterized protein n=1 Tax=Conoideocrella luteorostrata TaxID=1105319 RepID=A0AAJ0CMI6_9HYPO|nr:hypothetical protein QQS21_006647 [Conoideocrella luteorostrata]
MRNRNMPLNSNNTATGPGMKENDAGVKVANTEVDSNSTCSTLVDKPANEKPPKKYHTKTYDTKRDMIIDIAAACVGLPTVRGNK